MVSKNHVIFTDAEYRMTAAYLPKITSRGMSGQK